MADHSVHNAAIWPATSGNWLNAGLAVPLPATNPPPPDDERDVLRRKTITQAHDIGSRAPDAKEEEIDALLDEAVTAIRRRQG